MEAEEGEAEGIIEEDSEARHMEDMAPEVEVTMGGEGRETDWDAR